MSNNEGFKGINNIINEKELKTYLPVPYDDSIKKNENTTNVIFYNERKKFELSNVIVLIILICIPLLLVYVIYREYTLPPRKYVSPDEIHLKNLKNNNEENFEQLQKKFNEINEKDKNKYFNYNEYEKLKKMDKKFKDLSNEIQPLLPFKAKNTR